MVELGRTQKQIRGNPEKYWAIIEAATEIFAQHGYHKARMNSIAKEANVAEGTIYLYFRNKEDLLIKVFEEGIGGYLTWVEERLADHKEPEAKLQALVEAHFSFLGQQKSIALLTQIELKQPGRHLQKQLSNILKPYFNLIDNIILEGKRKEVFYQDIDPRAARRLIFGTLDQTVTAWVMSEFRYDLQTMTPAIYTLLARAVMKHV